MRCLIVDNYDSFTWNLVHCAWRSFGERPVVVRNDERTWQAIEAIGPFDAIIVSPGPGSPDNAADLRLSREAVAQNEVPVLGVCLGHQALAHAYGAAIERAPTPWHGRASAVRHDGRDLFAGLPDVISAVRYHSLVVRADSVPTELVITATTDDGVVMGLRHATLPKWGIQFHPESILTAEGAHMIRNFAALAARHRARRDGSPRPPRSTLPLPAPGASVAPRVETPLRVRVRPLPGGLDPEHAFAVLARGQDHAYWLDDQTGGGISLMGIADEVLSLRVGEGPARTAAHLAALERELETHRVEPVDGLPFAFRGGWVGCMGYEMKAAFGAESAHDSPDPDSIWMRARRFLAFDHRTCAAWLVAVAPEEEHAAAEDWLDGTLRRLTSAGSGEAGAPPSGSRDDLVVSMDLSRDDYVDAIAACRSAIADGNSYEVCLTNRFRFDAEIDPAALYRVLRRANPGPYGAYLKAGRFHVLSTSPERLVAVSQDGRVQSKPIKGTSRRGAVDGGEAARLAASEKDRAENLMIVDLMRNDLARVSLPGSVSVPRLMEVESFATVHQLVSTVEAQLAPDRTLVDVLRAVFPGGSVTGAPKIRTMEILDRLEPGPRGVYCGSIGYLGYGRAADLNVAIRTLSYDGETVRFGAGGAITWLSAADAEFDEMLLKAEALLRPIWSYLAGSGAPFRYRLDGPRLRLGARKEDER